MTAPTTRETADHAELARLAEASSAVVTARGDVPREECLPINPKNWSGAAHAEILAAHRLILLSEIAALRGDLTVSRDDLDQLQAHFRQRDREATQAERQRDELRKALEPFAKAAGKLDGLWSEDDWRWNDSVRSGVTVRDIRRASKALANQGADQ